MDFGAAICQDPHNIPGEIYKGLELRFTERQLVQLIAFAGIMYATNLFNTVAKVDLDEVLYKSLKEGEPNTQLFDYIVKQLQRIDSDDSNLSTMPLDVMFHTAAHLGIAPMDNYSAKRPLFNLKEGRFLPAPSPTSISDNANDDYFLDATSSSHFHNCLSCYMSHSPMPSLSSKQRCETLNNRLEYYHIHFPDFRNFKSHEVLHSVLR